MQLRRLTLWAQGLYTFVTAVWPLVHMESFLWASGYKTDLWLVKTVSVLLLSIAVCLLLSLLEENDSLSVAVLALLTAVSMAFVDFYYAGSGTIPKIYMADGALEILFALLWLYIISRQRRKSPEVRKDHSV